MICARCDKPIKPGEKYTKEINFGASLGGSEDFFHEPLCERPREVERPRRYPRQDRDDW